MVQQVALVTGGGTGVGRATALQLAHRGFDVIVNFSRSEGDANSTVTEIEQLGRKAIAWKCDVSDDPEVREMLQMCESEFGRLDVLINNAATTRFIEFTDLEALTEDVWDELLNVNLKGAFFVSRAAIGLMRKNDGGSIVNIASVAGEAGAGSSIAYAATKGGLITLTRSLARGFAPDIRVNAVSPGVIESRWLADHQEMLDAAVKVTPLQRASSTNDVADVAVFLACDAKMITGQSIICDGGRTI